MWWVFLLPYIYIYKVSPNKSEDDDDVTHMRGFCLWLMTLIMIQHTACRHVRQQHIKKGFQIFLKPFWQLYGKRGRETYTNWQNKLNQKCLCWLLPTRTTTTFFIKSIFNICVDPSCIYTTQQSQFIFCFVWKKGKQTQGFNNCNIIKIVTTHEKKSRYENKIKWNYIGIRN